MKGAVITHPITREPACHTKGCPAPRDPDWHKPWCGHGLAGHHHHVPKRSQGGKRIVAFLCPVCHMEVDNGISLGNSVWKDKDGREHYLLWDVAKGINEPLIDRVLEAGSAAAEAGKLANALLTPSREKSACNRESPVGAENSSANPQGISAAASPASGGKGEAKVPSGRQEPLGSAEARSEGRGAVSQPHPESGVAEPLDRGAPLPARDSRLVPIPSATPPSFDLNRWCEDLMKLVYLGLALRGAKEAWQLSVGDQYNRGEQFLGNKVFGYMRPFKDGAVRQYTWVAGCVSVDTRVPELSYTYYRAVAKLPPGAQKEWLKKAQEEHLNSKELYQAIHGTKPRVKRWTLEELRMLAREHWELIKDGPNVREAEGGEEFLDWLEATCATPAVP